MQAIVSTAEKVPAAAPIVAGRPMRIDFVSLSGDAAAVFERAASQRFTHVLIAPPWVPGPRGNPYLTTDFSKFGPACGGLGLTGLCKAASLAGIGLLLDVAVGRVAACAAAADSPFLPASRDELLDPRRGQGADAAMAHLASAGDALALAAWWAPRLKSWHGNGIAGFRLVGLEDFPAALLATFAGALRQSLPGVVLLAWTAGLSADAVGSLAGLGLDGVFLPASPSREEAGPSARGLSALRAIAPVLGVAGQPSGPHHASIPAAGADAALAAMLGQGWMHVRGAADAPDYGRTLTVLNTALAGEPALNNRYSPAFPLGEGGRVLAVLRCDAADHRSATSGVLTVLNADTARSATVQGASLLPATGGVFQPFRNLADGSVLSPETAVELQPGGFALFSAQAAATDRPSSPAAAASARAAAAASRLAIEGLSPAVDGGAVPVKAVAGELVSVEADVVFDGHEKIAVALGWHGPDGLAHEVAMRPLGNDRWQAAFPLGAVGRHAYTVAAWRDRFETFRDELAKKSAAGVNIALELTEGEALVHQAAARSAAKLGRALLASLAVAEDGEAARVAALLSPGLARLMVEADDRPFSVTTAPIPVDAERIEARYASWYEVFPRSMSDDETRHGTFADVERHLPRIAGMGFDVLYFPPISPIGRTNRKGRNNTLTPASDDPGSPYAIGSAEGGHDAVHPQLGSLDDFQHLRRASAAHGLELAIDFAIQCSPDHPWLKQHPGWFDWRPDGTIRYAENPPKKYEDIVNVDFYARDAVPDLWAALCDVVLFWAGHGVRLFRVDNPHTKPLPFWQWMIGEVRARYPDAIFLAEAFTRPKIMYQLAKIGFSQSYTYFTWRNTKRELEEYLTELDTEPQCHFFRPHFFVNTPDINPPFLQTSGRPGFLIRAALAATLSGLWGVYNGFELCEAAAVPGKEEYLDSEKYQLRAWDWDRPGNIVAEITALNLIRRQNPALQTHRGVRFLSARNDAVLYYEKATPDRSNVVLVAVSLDPFSAQEADFDLPLWHWTLPDDASLSAQDLLTGHGFVWTGKTQHLRLSPERPYAIWRVRPTISL